MDMKIRICYVFELLLGLDFTSVCCIIGMKMLTSEIKLVQNQSRLLVNSKVSIKPVGMDENLVLFLLVCLVDENTLIDQMSTTMVLYLISQVIFSKQDKSLHRWNVLS